MVRRNQGNFVLGEEKNHFVRPCKFQFSCPKSYLNIFLKCYKKICDNLCVTNVVIGTLTDWPCSFSDSIT